MSFPAKMQAPEGVSAATIQQHQYKVNGKGQIKVAVADHVTDLRLHGFTDAIEDDPDMEDKIDAMDDRQELIDFIEEHGGDADGLTKKKELRARAKETFAAQEKALKKQAKKSKGN